MEYEVIVGLEVHAEISTKSKIFCGCSTEFGNKSNSQVCPVCLGLPGALPSLNKSVVEKAIKAGLALNCSITRLGRMDRKNYFYPDSPKNYQITQKEYPICEDGFIYVGEKKIHIERIHIEEDAGKLLHTPKGSLVDYNRAGVPLIEIVSKPDIRSSKEAILYLQKLKDILSYIQVSDCKMEQGSLRVDLNVSVREKGRDKMGTRTEIKNLNSFKSVEKALNYEFNRQVDLVKKGIKIDQETRRWDETKNITISMRSKEVANDYRYFPEGDLVNINISEQWIEEIRKSIGELPFEKAERFVTTYGISMHYAELLSANKSMAMFFEDTAIECKEPKETANWLMGDISRIMNERCLSIEDIKFTPKDLSNLIKLIKSGKISNNIAKIVLEDMFDSGNNPDIIVEEKCLIQNSDESELIETVKKVLFINADSVEDYKKGKTKVLVFLVGAIMKETKGRANPQIVNKLVIEELRK